MNLIEYLKQYKSAGIAFSGGTDSTYLLYAAKKAGIDVKAYYVKTSFQPEHEFRTAFQMAEQIGVPMTVLEYDSLGVKEIASNPAERCYHCKRRIFGSIINAAKADGFDVIFDGTNASDDENDRPGMKAIRELKVVSPLQCCGITKSDVRTLSKKAGLPTWDKPSYSCLATRVKQGEEITADKLRRIEMAEDILMAEGFRDVRVRLRGETAHLEIEEDKRQLFDDNKEKLLQKLKDLFDDVDPNVSPR